MYERFLTYLRCPRCQQPLELETLVDAATEFGREIAEGLLHCQRDHWFPVAGGIPRMLPDSLESYWDAQAPLVGRSASPAVKSLVGRLNGRTKAANYDRRTRENFSLEWDQHDVGGNTWGMELDDRVRWFFLEPIRIAPDDLNGKVMLDAGCGNGSQSVAYTKFGLEVVAMDLSSGLENGQRLCTLLPGARPDRVHFVQGDLQSPPLAPSSFDLIHSAGVLHHTPDTETTFRRLIPLLRQGGTFYVWLYKHEPLVTPVVNGLRTLSTRIPPSAFARIASWLAGAFQVFCWTTNRLGLRKYPPLNRREATLGLMDIFGAPHAHYHSFDEVGQWFNSEGFDEFWPCNDDRRGFGVCGRLGAPSEQTTNRATAADDC